MNPHLGFAIVAFALPVLTTANYGHARYGGHGSFMQSGANNGVEAMINAAADNQQAAASLTAAADVSAPAAAQSGLAHANAQLQALNASPNYQSLKNSDAIAESLAENHLAENIRRGRINIVAPNVVGQTAFRSLLVPNGLNNHQVVATQPLQPIVVNQPGSPPAQISSGPPAVVRAAPVVYKLKPSIIYQQEVINRVPTPLSLNPVYVKVYKPGKQVDTPVRVSSYDPAVYGGSSYDGGSSAGASVAANEAAYVSPQYGTSASQYSAEPSYAAQAPY